MRIEDWLHNLVRGACLKHSSAQLHLVYISLTSTTISCRAFCASHPALKLTISRTPLPGKSFSNEAPSVMRMIVNDTSQTTSDTAHIQATQVQTYIIVGSTSGSECTAF